MMPTLLLLCALAQPAPAERDKAAEALLNTLMQALLVADEAESAKQVAPLVQKSLLGKDGALSPEVLRFSFRRARADAGRYAVPVKVVRARETPLTAVGRGESAEKGRVVDYYLARKEGAAGLPSPVKVFFPEGGVPRVLYLGAL